MDYQQTCIQKQKHLTSINFYQNLRQLYIMAPIITVRGPFQIIYANSATEFLKLWSVQTVEFTQMIAYIEFVSPTMT